MGFKENFDVFPVKNNNLWRVGAEGSELGTFPFTFRDAVFRVKGPHTHMYT